MKLYINTKKMTFNEENNSLEHEIILTISDLEFYGYNLDIDLEEDDKFLKDILKIEYEKDDNKRNIVKDKQFKVRADGWYAFPLYEIIDRKIVSFDYNKYNYFTNTDRRIILASKINDLYNPSSEAKILRKTLKYIMDNLNIPYPDFFENYNRKTEDIINKNPKKSSI